MTSLLIAAFGQTVFKLLLGGTAIFLILLVLVQRGRGGGLAGALGGMGGSSAFGAKAGDVFTKITVVAAAFWIVLCIASAKFISTEGAKIDIGNTPASSALQAAPGDGEESADEAGEAAPESTAPESTGEDSPKSAGDES